MQLQIQRYASAAMDEALLFAMMGNRVVFHQNEQHDDCQAPNLPYGWFQ